jgi:CDGSH-type Zn-finger protein
VCSTVDRALYKAAQRLHRPGGRTATTNQRNCLAEWYVWMSWLQSHHVVDSEVDSVWSANFVASTMSSPMHHLECVMQAVIKDKGSAALCRCFASSKFPLCDGSHNKHNGATGDNAGPAVLKPMGGSEKPKEEKATKTQKGAVQPLMDGLKVHFAIVSRTPCLVIRCLFGRISNSTVARIVGVPLTCLRFSASSICASCILLCMLTSPQKCGTMSALPRP